MIACAAAGKGDSALLVMPPTTELEAADESCLKDVFTSTVRFGFHPSFQKSQQLLGAGD